MQRSLQLAPVLILVIALAGCGQKTYLLKLDPKLGETYSYSSKMTGVVNMDMTMSMKAVKVDSGQVVMEDRISGMKMNGQEVPPQIADMFKSMVVTVTSDRTGRTVSTEVAGVPDQIKEAMKKQGSGNTTVFPDKPVKIGDTWVAETELQGKTLRMNYKLVRVEAVAGKDAAILEATPEGGELKMGSPMTLSIELATGMPITTKFEGEAQGKKSSIEMTRL